MTAREHAEKASQLAEAADDLRRQAIGMAQPTRQGSTATEIDILLREAADLQQQSERQRRAAEMHAQVALALAATDVTTGKATVKRRLA